MSLSVELISQVDDLSADDLSRWNELASNPFLRWEWLGPWWAAYGNGQQLYVLKVVRDGLPIAFVPWCLEKRVSIGRTIQFLGSGKASSDHLSLILQPTDRAIVCDAVATWLADAIESSGNSCNALATWDAIELIGVDASDQTINGLVEALKAKGLSPEQCDGLGCYAIDVPESWDEYIQMRSKSGRREIRQSQKNIDAGEIEIRTVTSETDLDESWNDFVQLHQRRRHASGTTGCFDHPPFDTFLRAAASELLKSGMLEMLIATANGQPVAAHFALVDQNGWFFYQSGMEPDASELRPGLSVFCHAIRKTIQTKRKRFDMLRGDEAYKQRWRATLNPTQEVRVCSPRTAAQLRNQAYNAGITFKNLIKSTVGFGQTHS